MTTVVEALSVSRRFGARQVLDSVDFRIDVGEIVGYVGPNGSGKTTTMRAMLGLVRLDRGELRIFGRDVRTDFAAIGPRLGAVFDQPGLHADLTVRETLDLYARLHGTLGGGRRRRVEEVIETMGLGARAGSRAKTLSKGLQQRLAFGRAIVHEPALLLLDEPFDGIDAETHHHVRELLHRLAASGTAIFLTSHDLHEVERLAARVVVLHHGRVVAMGAPADLRADRRAAAVAVAFRDAVTAEQILTALGGETERTDIELTAGGLRSVIRLRSDDSVEAVAARLINAGLRVRQFQPVEASLEDAYFLLTKEESG